MNLFIKLFCYNFSLLILSSSCTAQTRSWRLPGLTSETGKPDLLKASDVDVDSIGFFHVFRKPPWGGGNQFLLALAGELRRRGVEVLDNEIKSETRLYMANAITFKTEPFRKAARTKNKSANALKLVHRLDGPYYCARFGKDPRIHAKEPYRAKEDDRVFEINKEFACASIFQSQWSYDMNVMLGYKPKDPVSIINNAVDHSIFHNLSRLQWKARPGARKVKLLSSSWSSGDRKGFPTFKWLDDHLDFSRYEYTFIGNAPEGFTLRNIKILPPVDSEKLAPILRDHDIYIAASFLEPCSNALIEALACGLPTLFQEGSGHRELVKDAGLGYEAPHEIPGLLKRLEHDYLNYQAKIKIMSIAEATDKYLAVYKKCLKT